MAVSISVSGNWLFINLLPWLSTYAVFILIYKALPNTAVRWIPTLVGTLIAGTLFRIGRITFGYYVANIVGRNYDEMYGIVALLPIFAVWTYIAWMITLTGAEITYAVQNMQHGGHQEATEELIARTANDDQIVFINSTLAIRFFLTVAEHFYRGHGAYPKSQIMLRYGLSKDLVNRIFQQFKEEGLIYEVEGDTHGYLPARALSDITLNQVLDAFEGQDGLIQDSYEFSQATEQFLDQLHGVPYEIARNRSIEELLVPTELAKIHPA